MTILVLGATGNTGSVIVKQLTELQIDFNIMVNSDHSKSVNLPKDKIRTGNYNNVSSLISAFQGINRIYLVMPINPDAVAWTKNVITAAKKAGVQHIVKQSGLGASIDAKSEVIRDHAITDNLIKESGLDFTIIQPNTFFQNFYAHLPTINADGNFYSSLGDTPLSFVDINDVASVAVAALTQDGHIGKTHLITGAEPLTSSQHAKLIMEVSGKEINYVDIPESMLVDALKSAGLDNWLSEKLGEMVTWFTESNYYQITTTVEDVLGRKPRSFVDFAQELSHSITTEN